MTRRACVLALLAVAIAACTLKDETGGAPATIPAPSDVAAPPADALKTASGIASKILTVGLGRYHPDLRSSVTVNYTGWTADGKMFDSSVVSGQPITFRLTEVIPGWTEGLQLMVEGEKRRFWIPGSLAYDNSTRPDSPRGQLCFDVELLQIR